MREESHDGTVCVHVCGHKASGMWSPKYEAIISFLIQLLGMEMQCLGVSAS